MMKTRLLKCTSTTHRRRQSGAALVTGLVFLIILTLLGLSASSNAIQQENIASNLRDQNAAFQSAQAALLTAEIWLQNSNGPYANGMPLGNTAIHDSTTTPACDGMTTCEYGSQKWWTDNGIQLGTDVNTPTYTTTNSTFEVKLQPYYFIELVATSTPALTLGGSVSRTRVYRITARGIGVSPNTVRIVRSYYRFA